jgi:hypothetical protein
LADALRMLFQDREWARRMGDAARVVASRFAWRMIAERHLRLYAELRALRVNDRAMGVHAPRGYATALAGQGDSR